MTMRKAVRLSTNCKILTGILLVLFTFVVVMSLMDKPAVRYCIVSCAVMLALAVLYYMPISVTLTDKSLDIHRILRVKHLPLSEISSVKICPPKMATIRLSGSGGFFGYWGWFFERGLGKYFAYHGDSFHYFCVELKDKHKYVIGCNDVSEMVKAIQSKLK